MRESISQEFASHKPKAVVLDDNAHARRMTARRLRGRGFQVQECGSVEEFQKIWRPGMADVIVADWQLADDEKKHGDKVLIDVRRKDWDVPFVLVSGKLSEDLNRARVLQALLDEGGARFVKRGENGIKRICDDAEDLIERRDSTLLKVILSLRAGAEAGLTVRTSSGEKSLVDQLAELLRKPKDSHDVLRPVSLVRSKRAKVQS